MRSAHSTSADQRQHSLLELITHHGVHHPHWRSLKAIPFTLGVRGTLGNYQITPEVFGEPVGGVAFYFMCSVAWDGCGWCSFGCVQVPLKVHRFF